MSSPAGVLPPEFLERLRQLVPSSTWHEVLKSFSEPKPTTFRVNTLKAQVRAVREALEGQGFHLEPVPWCREAFILRRGTLRELQRTEPYERGELYVQGLSSMLPALILDPQPGETVLDLTAAPGSKTTQMACLMRNQGRIVANDNNKIRFFKLKANVERQGAACVELTMFYGEAFGRSRPAAFDRVLLDAPCSAEGRFDVREPASYRFWKLRKVKEMASKQKRLLASAIQCLKPGGTLVYSTCTFAPEENEAVLDWALERFKDEIEIAAVRSPVAGGLPGLTSWAGKALCPAVRAALRVVPADLMEGFFVGKLVRTS